MYNIIRSNIGDYDILAIDMIYELLIYFSKLINYLLNMIPLQYRHGKN